ncbi:MAG: VCBS repeat-containing protein [Actinobacteria bacterium]|nr:VCBS repeat-containing protein [Actinomycetota bacterium]
MLIAGCVLALTAGCAIASPTAIPDRTAGAVAQAITLPAESLTVPAQVLPAASTPVKKPVWVRRIDPGQTGWFSSPSLVDLDGDQKLEIVAPLYSTYVYSATGTKLATGTATSGRVYAPSVVADLDGDGVREIVVGGSGTVAAYEWRNGTLVTKAGWPASVKSGGQTPEVRGLAAADLDGNGSVEIVATTTNTSSTGSQVFVFSANGKTYQPAGGHSPAWPRYNQLSGTGNDKDFNGQGNDGYGAYGENVGIGQLDDDPELEIVVTFDNHQINVFNHDGTSVLASDWYTNRASAYAGERLGWGQFIRWLSMSVEDAQWHAHTGSWPSPKSKSWLQWTASPPSIGDLDGDGDAEVIGIPNVEKKIPYETQSHAVMVLDGAQDGGVRSGRRHAGFEVLPRTGKPVVRKSGDWYPPDGIPAPTLVDLTGDGHPEIVFPGNDGYVYAISSTGKRLWRYGYAPGKKRTFASEVVAADLNADGVPELVFGQYGLSSGSGRLIVLSASGSKIANLKVPKQAKDGNGIGIAAAPSVGDLDGDGTLEIVTTSIDHGLDVWTVPGSVAGTTLWPTGRGSLLRNGTAA